MFRRDPRDTRQPLMPGRKTRWRMFRLHFYLGFLVIVGWGFVYGTLIWHFGDLLWRPYKTFDYVQWTLAMGSGLLGMLPLPLPGYDWISNVFGDSIWFRYSELPFDLFLIVSTMLPLIIVALVFALLCYRRKQLTWRPFALLLVLLLVNSMIPDLFDLRENSRLGLSRLDVLSLQASTAASEGNRELALRLGAEARQILASEAGTGICNLSYYVLNEFAEIGDVETMQELLEHGATIASSTTYRYPSTIREAIRSGNLDAVELLLNYDAELGEAMVFAGLGPTRDAIAKMLVERGANVNQTGYEVTPLECAVIVGNMPVARYLVDQGADTTHLVRILEEPGLDKARRVERIRRIMVLTENAEIPAATEAAP